MRPSISLEKALLLEDFPSGSSIEYFNNQLYLIGDDAKHLLILNKNYERVDSVMLFEGTDKRIAKAEKADFEASVIMGAGEAARMLIFGSASTPLRKKIAQFTINKAAETLHIIDTSAFFDRLQDSISIINIEGAAVINELLVLANRANAGNPVNNLIITIAAMSNAPETTAFRLSTLALPTDKNVVGVSGLTYIAEADILLFTASTEFTATAYSDGKIGDSYIGWIKNATARLTEGLIKPDGFINLAISNHAFLQEKIESVCLENFSKNIAILHLISDNDNGQSRLFKIKLQLDNL